MNAEPIYEQLEVAMDTLNTDLLRRFKGLSAEIDGPGNSGLWWATDTLMFQHEHGAKMRALPEALTFYNSNARALLLSVLLRLPELVEKLNEAAAKEKSDVLSIIKIAEECVK